jgi:hypothetical protein
MVFEIQYNEYVVHDVMGGSNVVKHLKLFSTYPYFSCRISNFGGM